MENQLQINNTHQSNIALNSREVEIAKIIYHVNQLIAYPLSAVQIEDWSKTLNDFYPRLDLEILKKIIRGFKLGSYQWDPKQGIQNICEMLTEMRIVDIYSEQESSISESDYSGLRHHKI